VDNQSVSNVLGILRLLAKANPNHTATQLIKEWTGGTLNEAALLKVAAYLCEQCGEAVAVLGHSNLPDEVVVGLSETLAGVQRAFSLDGLQAQPRQFVKHVTGSISTLGMLLTFAQIDIEEAIPTEVADLAKEIEDLVVEFNNADIDPLVRSIAQQHLQTLATLLRHIKIFGLEAALATYFELLARLRRAESSSTPESKKAAKPFTDRIKGWADVFESIDKIFNTGARMLGRAKVVAGLITYFGPGSSS